MSDPRRIDTHAHVTPQFWKDELPLHGGDPSGWPTPTWSPELHLEFMDKHRIETSVLSVTAPSVNGWKGQDKRDMARRLNDYVAGLVAKNPDRWGNFATVPLPDIDGALEEIRYAFDEIKADGVVILSNYEGEYLGAEQFRPVWEVLNRRKAVVFIHPSMTPFKPTPGLPAPALDYPYDTTRTAITMMQNNVTEDFKDMKVILSHAGGMLPYIAYRYAVRGNAIPDKIANGLKSFYYDLALSASPTVIPALLKLVDANHITFGSDFNYAPPIKSGWFVDFLDTKAEITEEQRYWMNRGTAETLFPRLKK